MPRKATLWPRQLETSFRIISLFNENIRPAEVVPHVHKARATFRVMMPAFVDVRHSLMIGGTRHRSDIETEWRCGAKSFGSGQRICRLVFRLASTIELATLWS